MTDKMCCNLNVFIWIFTIIIDTLKDIEKNNF